MSPHPLEVALSSFAGGDGTYALDVDELWEGQPGNVFGGFIVAAVVRAAGLVHFHRLSGSEWILSELTVARP